MFVFAFLIGLFPRRIRNNQIIVESEFDSEKPDQKCENNEKQLDQVNENGALKGGTY